MLKKIDETGDVKMREGSGRPKSSRTENSINAVKQLISSQEDKPGTHAAPNEISKMMYILRTSIRRIIAEDLKLQPFKKIKGQRIDTRTKEKRIERCPNLRGFTKQVLETTFFSDEKIFKVTQLLNIQNDRTYAPSAYKKSTIKNKRLYVERSGFPMSLVVSVAVSKVGKSSIFFVEPGAAKVNGAYYREKLLTPMIPEINRLTGYQPYVFMQDGARSHTANETVRFLNQQQY